MTTTQFIETSVTVHSNSPFQDYVHPDDYLLKVQVLLSSVDLCTNNSCLSRMLPFSCFLCTAISSFMPLCFHLVLKRAPRFLSPVRHVDLSQGQARKASWSMAVLDHRQKFFNLFQFHLPSIDFALRLISFNTEGFDFLSFSF